MAPAPAPAPAVPAPVLGVSVSGPVAAVVVSVVVVVSAVAPHEAPVAPEVGEGAPALLAPAPELPEIVVKVSGTSAVEFLVCLLALSLAAWVGDHGGGQLFN